MRDTSPNTSSDISPLKDKARNTVKAWPLEGILVERYDYVPGLATPLPKHCHQDYQIGFSPDTNGGYFYRGGVHPVPMGHFSILHAGEVHTTTRQAVWVEQPRSFWMLYVRPDQLAVLNASPRNRRLSLPFFTNPVINDCQLAKQFLEFFQVFQHEASKLEKTERLLVCFSQLIQRYAEQRAAPSVPGRDRGRVEQVQAYLNTHLSENISLAQLAQLVELSPYHLHHVFHQEVGIAIHQYQIHARIMRAKQLLHQGLPLRQVAKASGFADQSHLTRQFKRFVQVTPGCYLTQK